MATTPIYALGESFYVPHFQVKIGQEELDPMVIHDIMQVTYTDKIGELDSVELTINNWDAQLMQPKYEPPSNSHFDGLFDFGKQLDLIMGYAGNTKMDRLMISGEITSLEPVFPESGPLTLSVRATSKLAKFRTKQHTASWPKEPGKTVRDTDIAREICQSKVTDDKPGLDVELDFDPGYEQNETEQPYVFMDNQYDIAFLLERARRNGYALYLTSNPITGKDVLAFKPSEQIQKVTYQLAWGSTLTEFHPTISTSNQLSKVSVRAWDRKAGKPLLGTAEASVIKINIDLSAVRKVIEGREEVVTDKPVYTKQEADALARSILSDQLRDMVQATGSTIGLPDLRAGQRIVIQKLGPRFSGTYFVTETTHTFGENGYRTNFGARREGPEEGASQ